VRVRTDEHLCEVAFPAECAQRRADRGIDEAARRRCCAQRGAERVEEQRADGERSAAAAVETRELGVVTEAAAGTVKRSDFACRDVNRLVQGIGLVDRHLVQDADRVERRRRAHHDPPDCTTGGEYD
jgi:hypothetical protein